MVGPELTVGGRFAGIVISSFVAKVRSIMEHHAALRAAAGDMLYSVEAALPRIRILVEATERRAISSASFAPWLQQFKDAVAEAEDLLDDFETKRIQRALRGKASSAMSLALRFVRNIVLSDGDLERLKDVLTKLNKITSDVTGFHDILKLANDDEGAMRAVLPATPPAVIGRDDEKQRLLNKILLPAADTVPPNPQDGADSSTGVYVISVVGAAGVGKTALAQVIYNDPNVKEAFLLRGWVFASWNCRPRGLEQDIIDSFASEQEENLQRKSVSSEGCLISVIQNKKFFLVLDDVQHNLHDQWGPLRSTLARGANGSVVLLLSQSKEVADSLGATAQIPLGYLPSPVLWRVFEHHAFGNQKRASLESIGKKVVQNLHGLPLLAEATGRLLRQRLDKGHWQKISSSPWWLFSEDEDDVALPSVAIMCEHLCDHLRKCLCYCSIFPSGYLFEKNMLIHMWIASFMQQHDEIGMDEMEKKWFDELFRRSFFQPTIRKNRYIMPDMIRKALCSIAGKECHATSEMGEQKRRLQDYRHLAISFSDYNVHLGLQKDNKLRTILFFDGRRTIKPHEAFANILLHPSGLRVLDFSYTEAKLEMAPHFIYKFTHLRFLDLSFTGVTVFPDSLCKLHLLQVLGLRGCQFKELPRAINELVNLRFLYAEAHTVSLIYKIGKLTNLQGLEEFPVGRMDGHKITELKNLNEISGQLCIGNLEEVASTDIVGDAELFKKRHLKKLVFRWGLAARQPIAASDHFMRTLAGLKPNTNLEELQIQCYMGIEFPAWIAEQQYLINLQRIYITECKQLLTLPPLGQLPSLVILILQGLSAIEKIGREFCGNGYRVFPSLKEVTFLDMPNWRTWSDIEELQDSRIPPFPHLKKVQIKNCNVLIDMPVCCLKASLQELEISGCNEIFSCNPSCLEGLNSLARLKIHHCLGKIYLPCRLLESIEILNLQRCQVYFQGGREHVMKLTRILTKDVHDLSLDETKAVRKELLVLEVLFSEGYHNLPSCFLNNWNSEAYSVP
ncbi:putative disease resistance RPP13-like protein 1 [Oryza brachyantha]|uniref:NB-ARC domain-containing protein n=1 Tax=Oryza brachyantha TaxID=4533 RepID=J3MLF3_ORYBR|nr:putative disease resistance RPP13-like protein 1 [Oryza brachyantha]